MRRSHRLRKPLLFLIETSLCVFLPTIVAPFASAQSRDITLQGMKGEKRLALVVGNASYASSPLNNTVKDARVMAQTLRDLGFEVI